ncbi:hypothetical protein HEK616_24100 [Streptomyces nigrescens]|uniref:Uncharacterized protein n=1 Tax=Streptomyces nigrescens TaxID=1920 RepID=A0ABM7ZRA8_STRNI|nr:hypothetical protein HEK616_24100 [Streptomyces nigrescens]
MHLSPYTQAGHAPSRPASPTHRERRDEGETCRTRGTPGTHGSSTTPSLPLPRSGPLTEIGHPAFLVYAVGFPSGLSGIHTAYWARDFGHYSKGRPDRKGRERCPAREGSARNPGDGQQPVSARLCGDKAGGRRREVAAEERAFGSGERGDQFAAAANGLHGGRCRESGGSVKHGPATKGLPPAEVSVRGGTVALA